MTRSRFAAVTASSILCALSGCAPAHNDLPFGALKPDEQTRATARGLSLQQVKVVRLELRNNRGASQSLVVSDQKVIAQLLKGLQTATETNIDNQVSSVEVIDKNGRTLLSEEFSTDYPSHALSLEFDEGLRQAGAHLSWSRSEAETRWKELNA